MSETPYGFIWGPAEVTRIAEFDGRRVLRIATESREVEVYISPKGRSVRVWIDGQEVAR